MVTFNLVHTLAQLRRIILINLPTLVIHRHLVMELGGIRQLHLVNSLKELAMITMVSNNHHNSSSQMEALALLLIIVRMLPISHLLLVMITDRFILKTAMGDILPLALNLDTVSPHQILFLGMISSKVITQHLDMVMHPTHNLIVMYLMEPKVTVANLCLATHPPRGGKVTLQVSSLAPNPATHYKGLPNLCMEFPPILKVVMGLSQLRDMGKFMHLCRLRSHLAVSQHMGSPNSPLVPKGVMISLLHRI